MGAHLETVSSAPPARENAWRDTKALRLRRWLFLTLVCLTWLGAVVTMGLVLARDGLTWVESVMVLCFAFTVPWIAIGFWNALIGLLILKFSRDPLTKVCPFVARPGPSDATGSRTAIVVPIFNESPERVFHRLGAVSRTLEASGQAESFDFFVLSDTQVPEIAEAEDRLFAAWRSQHPRPAQLHYRRRANNAGFKAGNLREFCERRAAGFEYMIILDADSFMSGEALVRLVHLMEVNPEIGILQSLAVGLPSDSAFARIFQFGMRQGMRTYTFGSAWWQGDRGPYWGHNAIVRIEPFRRHCVLPLLPGKPPLGGEVLSHDQVEAVLMRRAGYQVRVLPIEGGSYEENPPTLPDFLQRDLRWCQGNMQYFALLGMPGIGGLGRLQLWLAILMYLGAPFWISFLVLSLAQGIFGNLVGEGVRLSFFGELNAGAVLGLFVAMMGMTFTPRLLGMLDVMTSREKRCAYGGAGRVLGGSLLEILFSMLLSPVIALAQTIFIVSLFLGKRLAWNAQNRDGRAIALGDALRGLWPQLLFGLVVTGIFLALMPSVLPWAAPLLLGMLLAIPITVMTSNPRLGRLMAAWRVCGLPEEWHPPAEFQLLEAPAVQAPEVRPPEATQFGEFLPENVAAAPSASP